MHTRFDCDWGSDVGSSDLGGRMNSAQLERLGEHLMKLRLFKSRERLEALLQQAAEKELAYSDFLEQVLGEEVAAKTSKNEIGRASCREGVLVIDGQARTID